VLSAATRRAKSSASTPVRVIPQSPVVPLLPFFAGGFDLVTEYGNRDSDFAGAALGAFAVVASGGSSAAAALAALVGVSIVGQRRSWIALRQRRELSRGLCPEHRRELVLFGLSFRPSAKAKPRQILRGARTEASGARDRERQASCRNSAELLARGSLARQSSSHL